MAFEQIDRDCAFFGPALPEPFVKLSLEAELKKRKLLLPDKGAEAKARQARWDVFRRKLGRLGGSAGPLAVKQRVLDPLAELLGFTSIERQPEVRTREGDEDGGWLMRSPDGAKLRCWAVEVGTDLDAPKARGRAFRFSHGKVAARVLLEEKERVALLTDGTELRVLLCDPTRDESTIVVRLDRSGGWAGARELPDSFRLVWALASSAGIGHLPELVETARLGQTRVTAELRKQARRAVEGFVQAVLDHPKNHAALADVASQPELAQALWREGLILVYRLLFVFKLESSGERARAFSFASSPLWRQTYSPSVALARHVDRVKKGEDTGGLLEGGLRALFRLFAEGLDSSELTIRPLGGMLFGAHATPQLDALAWGEPAVAGLLGQLLWTEAGKGGRQRVHYGPLDVEDLGRVYEALLELEPGIATESMCRLRRDKLEVVVPAAQGEPYKSEGNGKKQKSKVEWIEDIAPGRFYLRVGLGRKSSGSYYTPRPFVRFLVQETLGPQVEARSPKDDPNPGAILELTVLDPAMGSGHFLVEACRFLGEHLYEACRLCDELASAKQDQASKETDPDKAAQLLSEAQALLKRVVDLPDPDDDLVGYLPSRTPEGDDGLSQQKALALCRRLVAVHCLYGVDKNELAVELAKLSLWLESYAEGLPLTFMNHRLIRGDSLTGPFLEQLWTYPGTGTSVDELHQRGLRERLEERLRDALQHVDALEASIGVDHKDVQRKQSAKDKLDAALAPFRTLAAAWTGGVMLGDDCDDTGYERLLEAIAKGEPLAPILDAREPLARMVEVGEDALPYDLVFPEVFHPDGKPERTGGFAAVVGNPPWETIRRQDDQFFAGYDLRALAGATKREKSVVQDALLAEPHVAQAYAEYVEQFAEQDRISDRLFTVHQARVNGNLAGRGTYDAYMLFGERALQVLADRGAMGLVLPSAFHANEGATGLRRLVLDEHQLLTCLSFENRRKLFEIDSRFKYALVVARRDPRTSSFAAGFYLHDPESLFEDRDWLHYDRSFVRATGGEYLSFLELRSQNDVEVAQACFANGEPLVDTLERKGLRLSQEVNMTYEAHRFSDSDAVAPRDDAREPETAEALRERGYLPLHEGKTFHQYDDRWEDPPRYLIATGAVRDKPAWLKAARYFRLAFRDIASSTNERTGIFCLLPPGVLCGNKAPCEREPDTRPNANTLEVLATANAFAFDFVLRTKVQATVNLFILGGCPYPNLDPTRRRFLAHQALRLSCNHAGYAPLWKEQLGNSWREPTPANSWPVLQDDEARWQLRAAIDALVADAYGLDRAQYEHVLSTFSHKSYPKAPDLCLAAFDELKKLGLEAFCKKHDPYWDIPLVETLPEPVIDLPTGELPTEPTKKPTRTKPKKPSTQIDLLFGQADPAPEPAGSPDLDEAAYTKLCRALEDLGELTSKKAQALLGTDAAGARPYLTRLVEEGRAEKQGKARGTKYIIPQQQEKSACPPQPPRHGR